MIEMPPRYQMIVCLKHSLLAKTEIEFNLLGKSPLYRTKAEIYDAINVLLLSKTRVSGFCLDHVKIFDTIKDTEFVVWTRTSQYV